MLIKYIETLFLINKKFLKYIYDFIDNFIDIHILKNSNYFRKKQRCLLI